MKPNNKIKKKMIKLRPLNKISKNYNKNMINKKT